MLTSNFTILFYRFYYLNTAVVVLMHKIRRKTARPTSHCARVLSLPGSVKIKLITRCPDRDMSPKYSENLPAGQWEQSSKAFPSQSPTRYHRSVAPVLHRSSLECNKRCSRDSDPCRRVAKGHPISRPRAVPQQTRAGCLQTDTGPCTRMLSADQRGFCKPIAVRLQRHCLPQQKGFVAAPPASDCPKRATISYFRSGFSSSGMVGFAVANRD